MKKHLERLLHDQCVQTDGGTFITIAGNEIAPNSLQNPSDPDASYRKKGTKSHVGNSLNLVEVQDQIKRNFQK